MIYTNFSIALSRKAVFADVVVPWVGASRAWGRWEERGSVGGGDITPPVLSPRQPPIDITLDIDS